MLPPVLIKPMRSLSGRKEYMHMQSKKPWQITRLQTHAWCKMFIIFVKSDSTCVVGDLDKTGVTTYVMR